MGPEFNLLYFVTYIALPYGMHTRVFSPNFQEKTNLWF